ncbi:hypothetical protein AYI68_g6271, partial [Smittium mucronatum]
MALLAQKVTPKSEIPCR